MCMKPLKTAIITLTLICLGAALGLHLLQEGPDMANDFSKDPSCRALWQFEPENLLVDSIGENDLTNDFGEYGVDCTSATGAGQYMEGDGSIKAIEDDLGYRGYVGIDDADLDTGFPFKDGDTEKIISFAFWFMIDAETDEFVGLCQKAGYPAYSIILYADFTGGEFDLALYGDSGTSYISTSGAGLVRGKWYHVGIAIDGVHKTYLIRSYDSDSDTAQTFSGSFTHEPRAAAGPFVIGLMYREGEGYFDEFVVFDALKDAGEFDQIRQGNYPDFSYTRSVWLDYAPPSQIIKEIPAESWAWRDHERGIALIPEPEWAWKNIPPAAQWQIPVATPRREVFICVLRAEGLPDIEVPMANMQLLRRDGNPTMVSCVVPDAMTYFDAADARKGGELIIMAGSITLDGERHLSELDRAVLETVIYDRGVRSSSLVLEGYRTAATENPRPVDLSGITYVGLQANGKRRLRGKVNIFLRPGDTAVFEDESFVVDQIYIYVEPKNAWMEAAGT